MKKESVFIIAEVGNLHNGSFALAKRFIRKAAECGADAVKFQTHIFDAESLPDAPNPPYFKKESRKAYFERTAFTAGEWRALRRFAEKKCTIEFMSSVFSIEAARLMQKIGIKRYKIPSGEATNLPLLEVLAKTRKPVLLSSGMSSWKELDNAVSTLKRNGCKDLTILQSASIYPCPPEKVGLNILREARERFHLPVGLSDHTLGFCASVAAVVLGAKVIEKHFTLSKDLYGSDAKHSLDPAQFKQFVREIRGVERMLSSRINKDEIARELAEMKIIFEKSIVARRRIKENTMITLNLLAFKKPGDGIRADRYKSILGKKAKADISRNAKFKKEMLL